MNVPEGREWISKAQSFVFHVNLAESRWSPIRSNVNCVQKVGSHAMVLSANCAHQDNIVAREAAQYARSAQKARLPAWLDSHCVQTARRGSLRTPQAKRDAIAARPEPIRRMFVVRTAQHAPKGRLRCSTLRAPTTNASALPEHTEMVEGFARLALRACYAKAAVMCGTFLAVLRDLIYPCAWGRHRVPRIHALWKAICHYQRIRCASTNVPVLRRAQEHPLGLSPSVESTALLTRWHVGCARTMLSKIGQETVRSAVAMWRW
mmetsp:Transcript_57727/g.137382  ORF Transcript_57727/g.137382 Transcript_57727/m.137382 type:complete len:263 (+) Transcript_57727:1264-2052(+)